MVKYWFLLAAKIAAWAATVRLLYAGLLQFRPGPGAFYEDPMVHHLGWTFTIFGFWLVSAGLLAVLVIDQRTRCRTCLRRLRMPVRRGSYPNIMLNGLPRTEYICPYGHGTLEMPELHITGQEPAQWRQHDDIWAELFAGSGKDR